MIIEIDTSTWTRMREVEQLASHRNIPLGDAILILVNRGLSQMGGW